MSTSIVVTELTALRDRLPAIVGSRWPEIQPRVSALLDRLQADLPPAEQDAAIQELVALLIRFPAMRPYLQRALAAGGSPGGRRGWDFEERGVAGESAAGDEPASPNGTSRREDPVPAGDQGHDTLIERWPHLDLDTAEPIAPGATVRLEVYADTTTRTGESGGPLQLPDRSELDLRVIVVTSSQLEAVGDDSGTITIRRDSDRSTSAHFELRAVAGAAGRAGITALFFHDGRPSGSVRREVIVGDAPAAASPPPASAADDEPPAPVLRVDPQARTPDLTIQIDRVPGGGEERFSCTVSSPLLDAWAQGRTDRWELPDSTDRIVGSYMSGFTQGGASNAQRRAALVGAGRQLFGAAPANFQDLYWALHDAGTPPKSVLIVSSEPFIPWELMIPNRDGDDDDDRPLGVSAAVGRWVHRQQLSPEQDIAIEDSYVIAPAYHGGKALAFSPAEAQFVCDLFAGQRISPATFDTIDAALGHRGVSLLHLICHGTDSGAGGQVIALDPDGTLSDFVLGGMQGVRRAVREKRPLVFINACEVGRPTPALLGTGGFASAFIKLGARCVVAPIWSVKDSVAGQVARHFYEELSAHPDRPLADIMRDIRQRAYESDDPEDSWAAYCYYGDPLTVATPAT